LLLCSSAGWTSGDWRRPSGCFRFVPGACRAVVVMAKYTTSKLNLLTNCPPQASDDICPDMLPEIRRKLVYTTAFILCALLLRLAFSVFEATGQFSYFHYFLAPLHPNVSTLNAMINCPLCNSTCSSSSAVQSIFLTFTPELRMSSNLVSVPLALLVALW